VHVLLVEQFLILAHQRVLRLCCATCETFILQPSSARTGGGVLWRRESAWWCRSPSPFAERPQDPERVRALGIFRQGRLIPYRVRLRPWIRCATAAAERSLTRLCDPGSIPPMLTGRGPNGRLRVLYATIVLLRLVSPDQRKIVGCSNRAPSEQAPWSRLGDMPVGLIEPHYPKA
jgi:hypothetical protein